MNEKIKRLVEQVKTDTSGKWVSIDNMEQLAELIIADCAELVDDYYNENILGRAGQRIRKHFGVNNDRI